MEANNKSLGGRVKYGTSEYDQRICELCILICSSTVADLVALGNFEIASTVLTFTEEYVLKCLPD